MLTVKIFKGLPGCGKTTLAKKMQADRPGAYVRVNKDDLRALLHDNRFTGKTEAFVLQVRDSLIIQALEDGKHVLIDDTNLNPKHETHIRELVKGKALVDIIDLTDTPLETCIQRDSKRPNPVGVSVIMNMWNQYIYKDIPLEPNGKPEAFIFDIDGTLAKNIGRGPFDWKRVGEDILNMEVFRMYAALKNHGYKIIIFSGRDAVCEQETKDWLKLYGIEYDELHMRPMDNTEKDYLIKKRMFEKVKNDYQVLGVFDDRKQVKRMWNQLGVFVFDVNQYDIEF